VLHVRWELPSLMCDHDDDDDDDDGDGGLTDHEELEQQDELLPWREGDVILRG
jgi:hypothetical protein